VTAIIRKLDHKTAKTETDKFI